MEIKGEEHAKIRAYSAIARTLQTVEEDLGEVIEEGRLGDIPGIGKALAEKIETLYATGELEFYDKLVASVPSGLKWICWIFRDLEGEKDKKYSMSS